MATRRIACAFGRAGVLMLVSCVLAAMAGVSPAQAAARQQARHAGADRYSTAVRIAEAQFPTAAPVVYIARGDLLFDALAAGSLNDGPVLLVPSCSDVPADVTSYINRVNPASVIALGGQAAVCDDTLRQAAGRRSTGRLVGADRYATAVEISKRQFANGAAVAYLANGINGVDAVAGGALTDGPILLVRPDEAPAATAGEINRLNPGTVVALGGAAAVGDGVLRQAAGSRTTTRVEGSDRIATAAAIARRAFPTSAVTVYLARADVFADAVAGGALTDGPILLVPQCGSIPAVVLQTIEALNPAKVTALGGAAAVCEQTLTAAASGQTNEEPQPGAGSSNVSLSSASAAPGSSVNGSVTGTNVGNVSVNGCGLSETSLRSGSGSFSLTIPAAQPVGACNLTFTTAFTNGSAARTQTVAFQVSPQQPTNVGTGNVTLSSVSASPGDVVDGTVTGNAVGAVTAAGCGLNPGTAARTGTGTFQVTVPATQPLGPCDFTFTMNFTDGKSARTVTIPFSVVTATVVYLSEGSTIPSSADPTTGSVSIAGNTYPRSISGSAYFVNDEKVYEYDLGRKYKQFKATAGMTDNDPAEDRLQFELYVDEVLRETSPVLGLGETHEIIADVTNALRLKLVAKKSSGDSGTTYVAWGNARLLPDGAVDSAAPTPRVGSNDFLRNRDTTLRSERPSTGSATVSGTTYFDSIFGSNYFVGDVMHYEYDLGKAHSRFIATAGLTDGAPATCKMKFDVFLDGVVAQTSGEIGLGQTFAVDLSVASKLRLKLLVTKTGGTSGTCVAAWGDARVVV